MDEFRIWIGNKNESRDVIGLKLDDANRGLDEIQPRRKTISMDSLSASMMSDAISITFPAKSNIDSVETKEYNIGMVARREVMMPR